MPETCDAPARGGDLAPTLLREAALPLRFSCTRFPFFVDKIWRAQNSSSCMPVRCSAGRRSMSADACLRNFSSWTSKTLSLADTCELRERKKSVVWKGMDAESRLSGSGLSELSDDDLLTRLELMAASEKKLGTKIVRHLVEVEARHLHFALGFPSLYAYAVEQLGFSRHVGATQAVRTTEFPALSIDASGVAGRGPDHRVWWGGVCRCGVRYRFAVTLARCARRESYQEEKKHTVRCELSLKPGGHSSFVCTDQCRCVATSVLPPCMDLKTVALGV